MHKIEKDDHKTSFVKYKLFKHTIYGLALVGNLVKGTFVSSEFGNIICGKFVEKRNARVATAESGGKILRKEEKIKLYLVGLDWVFKVEPIVIERLNHAVNFGMEFLLQQEVSISCSDQEAKSVTKSVGQERLIWLCSGRLNIPI